MPHVNVLSKIDMVERFGKLAFSLESYTDVLHLEQLTQGWDSDPFTRRYADLNKAVCELVWTKRAPAYALVQNIYRSILYVVVPL